MDWESMADMTAPPCFPVAPVTRMVFGEDIFVV